MQILNRVKSILKDREKTLKILIYIALFLSLIYPFRDKDWGWHYRLGEYFLTHAQIYVRDTYTWTMTSYAWINHEWLYDPIIYVLTNTIGMSGLEILQASIALFCFWLLTKDFKLNSWKLAAAAFFFRQILETGVREGMRSQSLALLPLAILIYLLIKAREKPKILYFLPPLFYLWANLHGTFVLGLGIAVAFLIVYFWQIPTIRAKVLIMGAASVIATLLTPFSYHTYLEALRHFGNPYLQNVFEWMPINLSCTYCHVPTFSVYVLILLLAALTIDTWKGKWKESLPYFLIALPLLWQAVTARRYLPLFAVSTLPFFAGYLEKIKFDVSKYKIAPFLLLFGTLITIEYNLFSRLPSFRFFNYTERDYCYFASGCSPDLVDYLKKHPPVGNGLNFYDWGGYLIYKQVPFKLFIDGRMHLWQVKDYSPFADYIEMYYRKNEDKFKAYDLDWVIAEPNSPIADMIRNSKTIGFWRIQYQDQYSVYFVRIR